jgi:hypothetical protein
VKDTASEDSPRDEEPVTAAVRYADQHAGRDNRKFLEALNRHFKEASGEPALRTRGRSLPQVTDGPARSIEILKDLRYLRNARNLARRTLGGLRVIGGASVKAGEFLDCVAVGSDDQWGCTGTLIARNVVLTAGHCADFATRIFIGTDVNKPGLVVRVKRRVRHPEYRKKAQNDLMVLVLETAVETVAPRKLAKKVLLDKVADGRVVGFGHTNAAGTFGYGQKRFVDLPVASPACRGEVGGHPDRVSYGCDAGLEFVAGRPLLERDSCNGDSGGPFYLQDAAGAWVLGGATSRATASAMNNCGDGGIYVRVDRYRTWIDAIPSVTLPA